MPDAPPIPHARPHRAPDPVAPLRSGDPHAFEEFYARYFPRVLAFARGRASSERGAQKLTEAILEKAIRMLVQGVPGNSLDALAMEAARRLEKRGH
jgi:DNA-directed RNA polymerase specialized sigma24 family protein